MSTRRMIGITVFGVLFIAAVIGVMMLTSYLRHDNDAIPLPVTPISIEPSADTEPDTLDRVEVTRDTIQAIISQTLSRPDIYSRDVIIETFWDGGHALYGIRVNVADGIMSLRISLPSGIEKRIIITEDLLYIWYAGDRTPYIGDIDSAGDGYRTADEWQMLITYEELLELDQKDIIEVGYTEFGGEDCIYAEYLSPLLGYTRKYYVSIDIGLVTGAEEYDETGALVYTMTTGECTVGEADPDAFTLPDGSFVT